MKFILRLPQLLSLSLLLLPASPVFASNPESLKNFAFPLDLAAYPPMDNLGLADILMQRITQEPFNLVASLIFLLAILHTFMAGRIMAWSHHLQHRYQESLKSDPQANQKSPVHIGAEFLHFLGEVEAVFGIWVLVLMAAMSLYFDWATVENYLSVRVNYTEPIFVVVIMTLAATKPILSLMEKILSVFASLGKNSPAAWWFSILSIAPLLGSFITEPAAMTIGALLLAKKFYDFRPKLTFSYATIGLLFVNISVGGTLTHFAAPPVLMVAAPWQWDSLFMLTNFGWKAVIGILLANTVYYLIFRKQFAEFGWQPAQGELTQNETPQTHPPLSITVVHVFFMIWTVFNAHHPVLFIGGFLFFLGFAKATYHYQQPIQLRSPLLVGFFLAGLVIHGGLQGWWIAPILGRLSALPLMLGATFLTAINDNAAITYLATLVPNLADDLKYAVVVGAVTGGGLTLIANAPNPAGYSILNKYFNEEFSALQLLLWAAFPTLIMGCCFMLL